MTAEFYSYATVVVLSRLVFLFHENELTAMRSGIMLSLQLFALLLFTPGWLLLFAAAALLLVTLLHYRLEKRFANRLTEIRLAALAVLVVLLSLLFSEAAGLQFNTWLLDKLAHASRFFLLAPASWCPRCSVVILGAALCLNELNLVVRYVFKKIDLQPTKQETDSQLISIDRSEYRAGWIIGILERLIVYIAVLSNQVAAIGFVLVAKGFTRFKELDKRRFAEYVLIGTLLSMLLAALTALLVRAGI
ncbi:MAG TPA: hypothetical protein ENJ29_10715 [Bacteroidetes bacterium]|nr:hypothetical protein [Bacteroidota bacterium]